MARFPKIDSPCPLDADAQRRIDGHCGHCQKTVHSLDGMSDAQRARFMREAQGPICVRYTRPAPAARVGRFGLAIAATLITSTAFAQDASGPIAQPARQTTVMQPTLVPGTSDGPPMEQIMVGGISDPADADWTDERAKPDLPADDTAAPGKTNEAAALDSIMMTGGVLSPTDAAWVDDEDTVADLPTE